MGVIFDLDQTLVDSTIALSARSSRNWQEVYRLIPSFTLYDGIIPLISDLNEFGIPISVVTSSPSTYCQKVLDYFGIQILTKVCYHDTTYRKPNPEPIQKAVSLMGLSGQKVISVGDDPKDIIASNRAKAISVAATWGSTDIDLLLKESPHAICNDVSELREFIFQNLGLKNKYPSAS